MTRKKPTLSERYASVILTLTWGNGLSVIDRESAKGKEASDIIREFESMINFDHGIHVAIDGTNHPTNLTPMLIADHREKTNKIDIPQIAKTKRIQKEHEEFRRKILAKSGRADSVANPETHKNRSRIRGRPMAGTKASGIRKKLNGRVERR